MFFTRKRHLIRVIDMATELLLQKYPYLATDYRLNQEAIWRELFYQTTQKPVNQLWKEFFREARVADEHVSGLLCVGVLIAMILENGDPHELEDKRRLVLFDAINRLHIELRQELNEN